MEGEEKKKQNPQNPNNKIKTKKKKSPHKIETAISSEIRGRQSSIISTLP